MCPRSDETPPLRLSEAQEDWLCARIQAATEGPWPAVTPLLGQAPVHTSLALDVNRGPLNLGVGDLVIRLERSGSGQLLAVIHAPLARGLVGLLLEEAPGPPAPLSPAEAGLLAGLADAALADLGLAVAGWEIRDVAVAPPGDALSGGVDPGNAGVEPVLQCVLSWECGPARGDLSLWLDHGVARTLWETARDWQPIPGEPGGEISLAANLVLARTTIPRPALAELVTGDAVLFPTSAPPDDGWAVELAVAGRRLPATLRRTAKGRELEIRAAAAAATADSEATPTDSTALLTALLGRVALTAGAVSALAPGAVISLDHPVGETVQLLADHQPLGSGELVEVNGELGVRLRDLTTT